MVESWKFVSEPYWDGKWVRIDYEMQNPDDTVFLPPDYPYRYFYRGEPWIGGACKMEGGSQMKKGGDLTGRVLFAGNVGDEVTLKLAKMDRDNVFVVDSYPDEVVAGTIPEPGAESWKSVSEPVWNDEGTVARIDYEGQNLVAGVTYEGLVNVPTAPIINAHGTQISSVTPTGYVTLPKSFLEDFGCTFPLEIEVHLQTELGVIKDTVTKAIHEPTGGWSKQDFINELAVRDIIPIEGLPIIQPTGGGWIDMYDNDEYAWYAGKTCNGKTFTIVIRLKPWATPTCSGSNPPTEASCVAWTYDEMYSTYGVEGTVPAACAIVALDELYVPPGAESWKSVSEPYWDGAYCRIDCEAQDLDPAKTYCAEIYHGEDFAGLNVLTDGVCTVSMTKHWMDLHDLTPPFDVDVKLVDLPDGTIYDTVTKTILEKPVCEDYDNQPDCEAAGCYWYNGSCHTNPPSCSELNNQDDCERFGCFWWLDGTCHKEPEFTPELNPFLSELTLQCGVAGDYRSYHVCIDQVAYDVTIDLNAIPANIAARVENQGDEEIEISVKVRIDGGAWRSRSVLLNPESYNFLNFGTFTGWLASGTHSIEWVMSARRTGGTYTEYYSDDAIYVVPVCTEGAHEVLEYCPDNVTPKRWRDCIGGEWIEDSQECPVCTEGAHEVLEYCPDGVTEKSWRDCVDGAWVEDSQSCPECYPEGAHEVIEYCPDNVTEKRWRDCIGGVWVEGSQTCPACIDGEKDIIEYCPDDSTPKKWWECIEGKWVHKSRTCPPVDGDRKCINFDLYEYRSGEWVLIKEYSMECLKCPFAVIAQGTDLVDFLGPVREFRDTVLKQSYAGRKFISLYYHKLTPFLSPILLRHALLKRVIRPFVRILVWSLSRKGGK